MFEKESQRYLTPGIKAGVPMEAQLLLWHLIDESGWQVVLSASLSFFFIFFAIWIFYYLKYKHEIGQINQKLR